MAEKKERELLFSLSKDKGDFIVENFRSGGPGGQHQNKTSSGAKIIHPASGATGESREERSQFQNKKIAFKRLIASDTFQKWHRLKTAAAMKGIQDIEQYVDKVLLAPENLKIETYDPEGDKNG
jgi:protein subunit release factor B